MEVDIYDYWIDKSDREGKNLNFIDKLPLNSKLYDAIIIAVGHSKFKDITTQEYKSISNGNLILIDVKGVACEATWKL